MGGELRRWEKALIIALKRIRNRPWNHEWSEVQRIVNILEAIERENGVQHVRTKHFKESFVEELKFLHRLDPEVAVRLARRIEERVPRMEGLAEDVASWPRIDRPGTVSVEAK